MALNSGIIFPTSKEANAVRMIGDKYDLKLILVHGSYAGGTAKRNSDLDIAILGRKEVTGGKFLNIYDDFSEAVGNNLDRELDLTTLHRADPLFCYQVAKKSRLLYGATTDYASYKAYAYAYYMDSKDLFELEKTLVFRFQKYLNEKYLNTETTAMEHAG